MRSATAIATAIAVVCIGFVCGACGPGTPARYCADDAPCATRYLAFQVFSSQVDPHIPIGSEEALSGTTDRDALLAYVRDIVNNLGERGTNGTRLAFMFGPITWDQDDDTVRALVDNAFFVGEELDVAVGFHIDDSMYWNDRDDLIADDTVEWSSFDGTLTERRYVFWALDSVMAPQLCYGSARVRTETTRRARDVIGAAIADHLRDLDAAERAARFAGVIAGWETLMPDYRYSKLDEGTRKRMEGDDAPFARVGFCSLAAAGFTADNPPPDMHAALEAVVHDWIALWTSSLAEAGLQRDEIYTHVAHPVDRQYVPDEEFARREAQLEELGGLGGLDGNDGAFSLSAQAGYAAAHTAFNDSSRPGFSIYPVGFDADDSSRRDASFQTVYDAIDERGGPWAISEGANQGLFLSTYSQEQYLAAAFNHGATLVNMFGVAIGGGVFDLSWTSPPWFTLSSTNPGAMEAYRKFLRGEHLIEDGE